MFINYSKNIVFGIAFMSGIGISNSYAAECNTNSGSSCSVSCSVGTASAVCSNDSKNCSTSCSDSQGDLKRHIIEGLAIVNDSYVDEYTVEDMIRDLLNQSDNTFYIDGSDITIDIDNQ